MFEMTFNGIQNREHGLKIEERPHIPVPERQYEEVEIPGRDGIQYKDKETYNDIEIPVTMHFITSAADWGMYYRRAKHWLRGSGKLEFSDDPEFYYKVKKISIESSERIIRRAGRFTAVFVCDPYMYVKEGSKERALSAEIYNNYDECSPVYRIKGEGNCRFSINGNDLTINVGQEVIFDTEKRLCYRDTGELRNIDLTGDYKDAHLIEGKNKISFPSNFNVFITPNWRCI